MKIETGLFNKMIVQRNKNSVSEAEFTGEAKCDGVLKATVKKDGKTVTGFKNKIVGNVNNKKLSGSIKGLKVGGAYNIELTLLDKNGSLCDSKEIKDLLVGDVWLLAGQSNMQGVGLVKPTPRGINDVRAFYMDEKWGIAKEPVHNVWAAKDRVHALSNKGGPRPKELPIGAGPGVAFGQEMFKYSGIPQGLVPCAKGATSMDKWSPKLKVEGGNSLYGAMYGRFLKLGAKVAGVVWYQGCSDTGVDSCKTYSQKMKNFIRTCRKDFKSKELPFIMVQIGRVVSSGRNQDGWTMVRNEQYKLSETFKKNFAVVAALDLEMEDVIHITGKDHNIIGKRLAYAANRIIHNKNSEKPEIKFKNMKIYPNKVHKNLASIELTFGNVDGELVSTGRPLGFIMEKNNDECFIFRTDLKKNKAILHTTVSVAEVKKSYKLYYGKGGNPICNITDAAGRAIPGFGPVKVK
jgi:sialate O-acetylesterase